MKKLLAVLMIMVMAMTTIGCKNDNEQTSGKAESGETAKDKKEENDTKDDKEEGAEKITLKFLYWADGVQKTLVEDAVKAYEDATGVHVLMQPLVVVDMQCIPTDLGT